MIEVADRLTSADSSPSTPADTTPLDAPIDTPETRRLIASAITPEHLGWQPKKCARGQQVAVLLLDGAKDKRFIGRALKLKFARGADRSYELLRDCRSAGFVAMRRRYGRTSNRGRGGQLFAHWALDLSGLTSLVTRQVTKVDVLSGLRGKQRRQIFGCDLGRKGLSDHNAHRVRQVLAVAVHYPVFTDKMMMQGLDVERATAFKIRKLAEKARVIRPYRRNRKLHPNRFEAVWSNVDRLFSKHVLNAPSGLSRKRPKPRTAGDQAQPSTNGEAEGTAGKETPPAIEYGIVLSGPDDPVLVGGKKKNALPTQQYRCLMLLIEAYPAGLKLNQFPDTIGNPNVTIRALRSRDKDFEREIVPPKRSGRGSPGTRLARPGRVVVSPRRDAF